jgi:hypothetical protein
MEGKESGLRSNGRLFLPFVSLLRILVFFVVNGQAGRFR